MLKIRLQRVGRKHDPSFRVVVTDSRFAAQSGKALEVLGSYNPRFDNPTLKKDRIKEWIAKGAQTSGTVHNILVGAGIIEGKKVNVLPKKAPIKKESEEAEAPAAEEASSTPADPNSSEEKSVKEEAAPEAPAEETPAEEAPTEAEASEDAPAEEEEKKEE